MTDTISVIRNAINNAALNVLKSDPETQECVLKFLQSYVLDISDSTINIAGDFKVSQQAKLAMQCVQVHSAQLRERLAKSIVEETTKSLTVRNTPVDEKTISEIVNRNLAEDKCAGSQSTTDVAVGAGVRIKGSTLTLGCGPDKIKRLGDECLAATKSALSGNGTTAEQLENNASCAEFIECLGKTSSFNIKSTLDIDSPPCNALDRIALEVALQVQNAHNVVPSSSSSSNKMPWWQIGLIITISVVVLAIIIAIVVSLTKRYKPAALQYRPQWYRNRYMQ